MAKFIKRMIKDASKNGITEGQEKYREYFIYTKLYNKYKVKVDTELKNEGYGNLIVKK